MYTMDILKKKIQPQQSQTQLNCVLNGPCSKEQSTKHCHKHSKETRPFSHRGTCAVNWIRYIPWPNTELGKVWLTVTAAVFIRKFIRNNCDGSWWYSNHQSSCNVSHSTGESRAYFNTKMSYQFEETYCSRIRRLILTLAFLTSIRQHLDIDTGHSEYAYIRNYFLWTVLLQISLHLTVLDQQQTQLSLYS